MLDIWGQPFLVKKTLFICKIIQYTYFNWTYNTCSYVKWVSDMSQYNKLVDLPYARFQLISALYLHLEQFWSAGIPTT